MLRSHYETSIQSDMCCKSKTLEVLTITLRSKQKLLISVVYRHPKPTSEDINTLSELFHMMSATGHQLYILGDLNCDLSNSNQNANAIKLTDCINQLQLSQLISAPTRATSTSSICIDLIITNAKKYVLSSGVIEYGPSDHDLVYAIIQTRLP